MGVKSYRELLAWQKSMDFVQHLYEATKSFPDHERYGLTSQIRRAAVSVPSNIAEGQGRGPGKDFDRFLYIANGSLFESETQILIAQRLSYISTDTADTLLEYCAEVGRLIHGLQKSIRRNSTPR